MGLAVHSLYRHARPSQGEKLSPWPAAIYLIETAIAVAPLALSILVILAHMGLPLGPLNVIPVEAAYAAAGVVVVFIGVETAIGLVKMIKAIASSSKRKKTSPHQGSKKPPEKEGKPSSKKSEETVTEQATHKEDSSSSREDLTAQESEDSKEKEQVAPVEEQKVEKKEDSSSSSEKDLTAQEREDSAKKSVTDEKEQTPANEPKKVEIASEPEIEETLSESEEKDERVRALKKEKRKLAAQLKKESPLGRKKIQKKLDAIELTIDQLNAEPPPESFYTGALATTKIRLIHAPDKEIDAVIKFDRKHKNSQLEKDSIKRFIVKVMERGREVEVGEIKMRRVGVEEPSTLSYYGRPNPYLNLKDGEEVKVVEAPKLNKVFIDWISSDRRKVYKGIGTMLIQYAFEISALDEKENPCEGRVMLEATRKAHAFFWLQGFRCMHHLGNDDTPKNNAFENEIRAAREENRKLNRKKLFKGKPIFMYLPEESIDMWQKKVKRQPLL